MDVRVFQQHRQPYLDDEVSQLLIKLLFKSTQINAYAVGIFACAYEWNSPAISVRSSKRELAKQEGEERSKWLYQNMLIKLTNQIVYAAGEYNEMQGRQAATDMSPGDS